MWRVVVVSLEKITTILSFQLNRRKIYVKTVISLCYDNTRFDFWQLGIWYGIYLFWFNLTLDEKWCLY